MLLIQFSIEHFRTPDCQASALLTSSLSDASKLIRYSEIDPVTRKYRPNLLAVANPGPLIIKLIDAPCYFYHLLWLILR